MTLKFYRISGSPFAWRVHLALEHKRARYELVTLSVQEGDLDKAAYLAINPRGKAPSIVDDGFPLYESGAIVEYIEDRFPDGPRLFPEDVKGRALVRRIVSEVDSYVAPHHLGLVRELFRKSDPAARDAAIIAKSRSGWLTELAFVEPRVLGDFLAGDRLTAADLALYPFVATFPRFELRQPDLGLSAAMGPKLSAWKGRIEALPYFDKTYPAHWRG